MFLRRWMKPLRVIPLVAAMLAATTTTLMAAPPGEGEGKGGLFGEVVAINGSTLQVLTKDGNIQVSVTADTQFRAAQEGTVGLEAIKPHYRIAALVVGQGEIRVAQQLMVIPQQTSVFHITGVVAEAKEGKVSIVVEDGRRVPVELGFSRGLPTPGVVVTIAAERGPNSELVRAHSIQRLDETLERLRDDPEEIKSFVLDRQSRIRHLARVQRVLERTSERQLEILNRALQHAPQEASLGLEQALHNLDQAKDAAARAFNQALELASESGPDHIGVKVDFDLMVEIEPSVHDLAVVLKLSEDALIERLGQGRSLAEVAKEVGVTQDDLVDGVLDRVRQRLEDLVAKGRLAPAEVDRIINEMRKEASHHLQRPFAKGEFGSDAVPFSMEDLAQILSLEPPELFARFHKGSSLLQIAQQQGLSREKLLGAIMSLAQQRAQILVGQGVMRPKDVEKFLHHFLKQVEEHLEEVWSKHDEPQDLAITPEDVAIILGISVPELMAHFENQGTLEQLALRQGTKLDELVARILNRAQARLNRLVEAGKVSRIEADQILAHLKKGLLEVTNAPHQRDSIRPFFEQPGPQIDLKGIPFDFEGVARILGLPPRKLHILLAQGLTLEVLAEEKGLALGDLANRLMTPMEEKLQEMVQAGHLSEEQSRYMLREMRRGILQTLKEFRMPQPGEPFKNVKQLDPEAPFLTPADLPFTAEDVAQILGISTDSLMAQLKEGKDIHKLLEEHGLTAEQFAAKVLFLVQQRLKGFVVPGEIPAEAMGHIFKELGEQLSKELSYPKPTPVSTPKPTPVPTPTVQPKATPTTSAGQNVLVLPHRFSGTAKVNGASAVDGTKVTAVVNGETVASTTTVGGSYSLTISQLEGQSLAGAKVTFTVGGFATGHSGTWEAGAVVTLNLTVSSG